MSSTRLTSRGARWLACGAAVAALLATGERAEAIDPSLVSVTANVTYEQPRQEGYRVDWCESWATNCGKPAADRFCNATRGHGSAATKFEIDSDIGLASPTRTQVDRKVCAESFCDGFRSITCSKPAPVVAKNPSQIQNRCRYSGQKSFGVGKKKYARGELVGRVSVNRPEDKKESDIDGRLRVCFAGRCADLAKAGVEARSNGESRVFAGVVGRVWSAKLSAQGGWDKGPWILEEKLGASFPIVPGVRLSATAGFGAGMELHSAYDIRALPPIADLSGTVKTFANGKGAITASILGGVAGSASIEGVLQVPSPDVIADLDTRVCGAKADARVDLKPWRLQLLANAKVACVPYVGCAWKGSKLLLKKSGGSKSYQLF